MRRARNGVRGIVLGRRHSLRGTGRGLVAIVLGLLVGAWIALALMPSTGAMGPGGPGVAAVQHARVEVTAPAFRDDLQSDGPCRTICPAACSYANCGVVSGATSFETGPWAPEQVVTRSIGSLTVRFAVDIAEGRRPPVSRQALSISRT